MREFNVQDLTNKIAQLVQEMNVEYPKDIYQQLNHSYKKERNVQAKNTLQKLIKNADVAKKQSIPICQDTGMVVVFMQIGQEIHFVGGDYETAINEGVRIGYQEGFLRKSIVDDPLFKRANTQDNTPCIIYTNIIPGDKVILEITTKGFGSENMSCSKMLKPAQGVEGVKGFVLQTLKKAGPNACPPFVVGVGIGGSFDYAAVLAKKATLRNIDIHNKHPLYKQLEEELLQAINRLYIGPQGLGGDSSALGLNIEYYPTHIAGLPVAVNVSCHITRHAKEVL
ncbi:MAG: fumarate hydratase [Breznakia sp.]